MRKKKKEKEGIFFSICEKEFQYLVDEFNCKIASKRQSTYSETLMYKSSIVAIEISYEPREKYIFILLIQLVKGEIPEYPTFIRQDSKLHSFYLDDLLRIRNPSLIISRKPRELPFTDSDMMTMLKQYAHALRKYASDILIGNFDVFSTLEKMVKKRAKSVQL